MINAEAVVVDTMAWPLWAIAEVVLTKVDAGGVGTIEMRVDVPGMAPRIVLKDTPGASMAFDLLATSVPDARTAVGGLIAPVIRSQAKPLPLVPPPIPPVGQSPAAPPQSSPPPGPDAPAVGTEALPPPGPPKDPNTLWEGTRRTVTAATTGMVRANYRITRDMIYFDAGLLSSRSEQIPLWAVRDVDIRQSVTQKARNVGDVIIRCQHSEYTGRPHVVLESIQDPRGVRDLLNTESQRARLDHQARSQTVHYSGHVQSPQPYPPQPMPPTAAAPSAPPPAAPVSIADELKKLAELRDLGVLTEDEFAAQKARLLGA